MSKKNSGAGFLAVLAILGCAYGITALVKKEPDPLKWFPAHEIIVIKPDSHNSSSSDGSSESSPDSSYSAPDGEGLGYRVVGKNDGAVTGLYSTWSHGSDLIEGSSVDPNHFVLDFSTNDTILKLTFTHKLTVEPSGGEIEEINNYCSLAVVNENGKGGAGYFLDFKKASSYTFRVSCYNSDLDLSGYMDFAI